MNDATKQYIELYEQYGDMLCQHSCSIMNNERETACQALKMKPLPTRKTEEYKYSNMQEFFAPNLGVNLKRLDIPVNPYDAFKCDVPNLSTQLYFIVNDAFPTWMPLTTPASPRKFPMWSCPWAPPCTWTAPQ